jgi:rare lipoprotein A
MIRRQAASLCVLTFVTADVLLIGAAGLGPKMPVGGPIIAIPLASPPEAAASTEPSADEPAFADNQVGVASWYGDHWQGRVTASGQRFDERKLTAAHRTLPLNSEVRVTNIETGRSVEVTITDRGPYVHGRVIDLSKAAAKKLGIVKQGLVPVEIKMIAPPTLPTTAKVASLDAR